MLSPLETFSRGLVLPVLLLQLWAGDCLAANEVKVIALFSDKALLQVDGKRRVVSGGETFAGVLLVSASARGAVVEIDGERMRLAINQSAIAGSYKKPERSSVRVFANRDGVYYVDGSINGKKTRFVVDTGATFVTLSGRKAKQLGIDYSKGVPGTLQTAAAVVPSWNLRLDSVEVGGIDVSNVEATVIEGDQPVDVLLGNSFLKHTVLQKAGAAMELRQRY